VIASDRVYNQKGVFKLRAIRDAVQMGVFDYMGDSIADLPIFQAAHEAILVHPSKRLLKRTRASCRVGRVFEL
jgi:phosphoserine phosphatase